MKYLVVLAACCLFSTRASIIRYIDPIRIILSGPALQSSSAEASVTGFDGRTIATSASATDGALTAGSLSASASSAVAAQGAIVTSDGVLATPGISIRGAITTGRASALASTGGATAIADSSATAITDAISTPAVVVGAPAAITAKQSTLIAGPSGTIASRSGVITSAPVLLKILSHPTLATTKILTAGARAILLG